MRTTRRIRRRTRKPRSRSRGARRREATRSSRSTHASRASRPRRTASRSSASGRGRTTACRVLRSSFKSSSSAKKGVTMAVAVDFRSFTPVDARVDLIKKVEGAPVEHAEAVLAAYELLQQLHAKGILELLTGLLTAGEAGGNHVVGIISSPQAVTATRLGLMMVNMLGSIDADKI